MSAQDQPLRIGLYGGAFDPPHRAHVALAGAAIAQLALDVLYVIPTGQPWMKQRQLTSAPQRLAMARLAFESLPQVWVDDCEMRRTGTTYTIDTLRELQQRHCGQTVQWYLVMGQDLVESLPRWQRADELLRAVTVAVLQRPDAHHHPLDAALQQVRAALPELRVVVLQAPPSTISSTAIRTALSGASQGFAADRRAWLRAQLPDSVAHYIEQHHLYRTADGH